MTGHLGWKQSATAYHGDDGQCFYGRDRAPSASLPLEAPLLSSPTGPLQDSLGRAGPLKDSILRTGPMPALPGRPLSMGAPAGVAAHPRPLSMGGLISAPPPAPLLRSRSLSVGGEGDSEWDASREAPAPLLARVPPRLIDMLRSIGGRSPSAAGQWPPPCSGSGQPPPLGDGKAPSPSQALSAGPLARRPVQISRRCLQSSLPLARRMRAAPRLARSPPSAPASSCAARRKRAWAPSLPPLAHRARGWGTRQRARDWGTRQRWPRCCWARRRAPARAPSARPLLARLPQ